MRPIDADIIDDYLGDQADEWYESEEGRGDDFMDGYCWTLNRLQDEKRFPTIDAVPVIRCKNCMYNYGNKYECDYNHEDIVCTYWMSDGLTDKDFCSKGEKKK